MPSHLQAYRDVFQKVKADELPPHREGVDYDIQLESENILSTKPLYSMSIEHLKLMKEYLEEHLRKGFIVPSEAPFASPVLFAEKPEGGWRFCVDYRKLNEITKKDRYPVPLIEETLARLSKARVFTKLDVRHAFNRIRLKESIEDLTTFRTRYRSYKYRVIPFGLCNGPASFQRFINSVLFDYLDDFCTAYIDDILIYSDVIGLDCFGLELGWSDQVSGWIEACNGLDLSLLELLELRRLYPFRKQVSRFR